MVGEKGIEPPRIAAQDPKSSASTNFATRPKLTYSIFNLLRRNWLLRVLISSFYSDSTTRPKLTYSIFNKLQYLKFIQNKAHSQYRGKKKLP